MDRDSAARSGGSFIQRLNPLTKPHALPQRYLLLLDVLALAWIGWFAWHHAGFLLRDDLFLYGDHPGQFYRLWHLLGVLWPESGQLIGWSPYWYAGYPELQFYPPGFALAGWLIWMGSLQQLSFFAVYETLVFTSFILPAISFYLLLARGLGDRLAGLAAAWLVMATPFPLGGAMGVMIGLIGERLAFGLMPLVILSGLWLMQAPRKRLPWFVTGFSLAWIMLLHPYQAIVPTTTLGLYILFRRRDWGIHTRWLILSILLGFGLIAFWWLPLGWRRHFFIPLIEAPLPEIRANLEAMWVSGMGWLLVAAIVGLYFRHKKRRWLPLALFVSGVAMLGFIFFDYQILVQQFNIFALDPVRLTVGVTFVLFIGLALGLSELAWLAVRLLRHWQWDAWGLPLVLIVPLLIYGQVARSYDFAEWISVWQPGPDRTPIFLEEAGERYHLAEIWDVMAATPGRVLFTSHYGLLFDIPTTLKAATPYLTGREIIGGTFTHRTPVGSYLWLGQAKPPVLQGKVEQQDDETLAGISWNEMSENFLYDLTRRYNVTLIAATAADRQARAFLDTAPRFQPILSNRLLTLYEVVAYDPSWVATDQAQATVRQYRRNAIDIAISDATHGAALSVKVANYDLWQAEAGGRSLPVQTDEYGLMKISLPPGTYTVRLRYQPGFPERLGTAITLVTGVVALGSALFPLQKYLFAFGTREPVLYPLRGGDFRSED